MAADVNFDKLVAATEVWSIASHIQVVPIVLTSVDTSAYLNRATAATTSVDFVTLPR